MADPREKVYRPWPSEPPSYQQVNSEQFREVVQDKNWHYSLFDCCDPGSLCLMSCCLPCLTFGKTQARVQDANLKTFSYFNSDCIVFSFLGMFASQWIIQTIKRGELRKRFGIKGSCCGDCCATACCGCCALVQEEKEAELRTRPELMGYQPAPQMAYP